MLAIARKRCAKVEAKEDKSHAFMRISESCLDHDTLDHSVFLDYHALCSFREYKFVESIYYESILLIFILYLDLSQASQNGGN